MHIEFTDYLGGILSITGFCLVLYFILSWKMIPAERRQERKRKMKIRMADIGMVFAITGIGVIFQITLLVLGVILMVCSVILIMLWLKIIMDPEFRDVGLIHDPKVPQMKKDAIEQFLAGYVLFISYFGVNALENWLTTL